MKPPERTPERERWQRVEEIFLAASELPKAERAAYIETACGGDTELRSEVQSLLAHDEPTDEGIHRVIRGALEEARNEEQEVRAAIGPYRILQEIGRGGLSTVFLAERADDQYRMQVAIKLVRRGLDTQDILRRLRRERQILANLNHPNIARLLDGGTTEDGLPYLAMEYVAGEHIDHYCERKKLPLKARLELFRTVAGAVAYAHQNLVIHRDLKPSNLLVTEDGTPKLLDFGIAKLLDPESATTRTFAPTHPGLRLLTPEYASPEQVRGETLTTATDIYSLGVLLYRMITGKPPYLLTSRRPQVVEEIVCRDEVPKPSVAVRQAEASLEDPKAITPPEPPERLARHLAGDLDNIVGMALRKEPARRYGSVEQFSRDIERHLTSQPVSARPDTLAYRATKFIGRHKAGVLAAGLIFLALVAGIAATTWQARVARANLAEAERQRAQAVRMQDFLEGLFKVSDPEVAQGKDISARQILDQGAERVGRELQALPAQRADLAAVMGRVYRNLGLYAESEVQLQEALTLRREVPDTDPADLATSLNELAVLYDQTGAFDQAVPLFEEALVLRREVLGEEHPKVAETLNDLGALHYRRGDLETAAPLLTEALALRRRVLGEDHPDLPESLNNLAAIRRDQGDLAAAEDLLLQAWTIRERVLGEDHPVTIDTLSNLGVVYWNHGELDAAAEALETVLDRQPRVLGPDHPALAGSLNNLASVRQAQGRLEEAETLFREALAFSRRTLGPDHPYGPVFLNNLGDLRAEQRDWAGATDFFEQALEIRRRILPAGHWQTSYPLLRLGEVALEQGNSEDAEPLLREAYELRENGLPKGAWQTAVAAGSLAVGLAARDQMPGAEALYRQAQETLAAADKTAEAEALAERWAKTLEGR
ncbi:MAG: serine/threonine-protein kinase [Acidobacteriota bacterium]